MWTEEKLNSYIQNKVEENLYLDYKASEALVNISDKKKDEISKDVSAFANSDGGTIIYGIKEFKSGTNYLPEKIDPIDRLGFSKETLEEIINFRVAPRIHGIIITPVIIGREEDNKVVYIVDIPKSNTAHQASDKRYYRRYNFQSIPMNDWEIKDIINRSDKALIDIVFRPKFNLEFFETYNKHRKSRLHFDILAGNRGTKVVEYCDCILKGSESVASKIIPKPNIKKGKKHFELYYKNEKEFKITLKDTEFIINTKRVPIPPSTHRKIGELELYSDFFIDDSELIVNVSLDNNRISKTIKGRELIKLYLDSKK